MHHDRTIALFAAMLTPGIAAAQVPSAQFDLDDSTFEGYYNYVQGPDGNGGYFINEVGIGGASLAEAWATVTSGYRFVSVTNTSFAVAASTSGGINDPKQATWHVVGDIDSVAAGLQISGSFTQQSRIVVEIVTPDDAFVDFQMTYDKLSPFSSLGGVVQLDPSDGASMTIMTDESGFLAGQIKTGRFIFQINPSSRFDMTIVPATPTLALALPLLVIHRRKRS